MILHFSQHYPLNRGFFFVDSTKLFYFHLQAPLNSTTFSRLLARSGVILIILFAGVVLFDVFPPKLLQPDWLLNFGVTLSNTLSIPLVGIVLVHIASFIDLQACNKLTLRVARFSALLALLFLLVQPMLAFALWKNFRDLNVYNREQMNIIATKGQDLTQAIQNSVTFEELQTKMSRLQGPNIPDQARSLPLPELKKQLLFSIKSAQEAFSSRLATPTSEAYKEIYKRLARTSFLTLIGSVGFALLARNPTTEKNILLLYLKSIGLFGITPSTVSHSIKSFLENQKERQLRQGVVKDQRKSALNYQRQLRKAESQQLREQKRRQDEEKKHTEKRRQEREKLLELERKMARKQELEEERERDG